MKSCLEESAESLSNNVVPRHGGRLLVRLLPHLDEAVIGYLNRLCLANGVEGTRAFYRLLMEMGGGRDALNRATGLPVELIDGLGGPYPSYWGLRSNLLGLSVQDFNQRHIRWCPRCLNEGTYLRVSWTLKLCCFCPKHRIWLHENCPRCGKTQSLNQIDFCRCECGAVLSVTKVIEAPAPIFAFAAAFDPLLSGCSRVGDVPDLDRRSWHRLIRYLGQFEVGFDPERPGQLGNLHHLALAAQVVTRAATLLDCWPRGFHNFLEENLRSRPNSPSLRATFGRLYRVLYVDLGYECFQFLRDAFEALIHDSWWGLLCKRHRAFKTSITDSHPRLSLKQAAQKTGVGLETIRLLGRTENIDLESARTATGRTVSTIHQDQLELITGLVKTAITLSDAAKLLAIPKKRVHELIQGSVIAPLYARKSVQAAKWLIPRGQIDAIVRLEGVPQGDGVSIRQILKCWRLQPDEFSGLVTSLLDGNVSFVASSSILAFGDRCIPRECLKNWLRVWRENKADWFSVDQAAKRLGIKQEVAYHLVHAGFISTIKMSGIVRIHRTAIAEFQRDYVSLIELTQKVGMGPRGLLASISARPVCGPTVDGCRQYFFDRNDQKLELSSTQLAPKSLE